MFRLPIFLTLIAGLLLSSACSSTLANPAGDGRTQQARILLWHTWDAEQAAILDGMLATYQELHPHVEVISVAVAEDNLVTQLNNRSRAGLGPDLILTDAGQIYRMAESGLIRDLAPLNLELSDYLSTALNMLSDDMRLYGLPMATHTNVLYYNRNLVTTPPATLAELVERTEAGEILAQSPHFIDTYWGIGAHDGGMADNQNRLLFGQGGFMNWLDFLKTARTLPGFLLDEHPATLRQAFIDGEVAYYAADSNELAGLVAAMGADTVGVALLPSGPNGGAARPLLNLEAFAFTDVSNDREFQQARALVQFLTDVQNQLALATTEMGLAPVNNRVRLTPNLPESSITVARQSRNAESIPFVNRPIWNALESGALDFFDAYQQVTQGVLPADEMIAQGLANFEETYGLRPKTITADDLCPVQPAAVTLWHSLRFDEGQAVEELAQEFEATCPGMQLTLTYVPAEEISARFREANGSVTAAAQAPDMLILSSRWLAPLAEEGLLLDLSERVAPDFLQQFLPESVGVMRYQGRLYGIPESLEVLALFYNSAFVSDPPIDIQQLVQNAGTDVRLALPVGFFWGYWGMAPFGGFEFDSYSGRIGTTTGLVNWLSRLQHRDIEAGIDLYFDDEAAEDAFAFEEAAYLVSGPWSLPRLRQELGDARFQVVPLPSGPLMAGNPMLQVVGTVVSADADDLAVEGALAFSHFLSLQSSQQRLAATGSHVSASVTVDLSDYPNIEGFREQAKAAALVVENSKFARLEAEGDLLYQTVLIDGVDPEEAVPAFVAAVHGQNGIDE